MPEQLNYEKMAGMCPHGNFPDKCGSCKSEKGSADLQDSSNSRESDEKIKELQSTGEMAASYFKRMASQSAEERELQGQDTVGESVFFHKDLSSEERALLFEALSDDSGSEKYGKNIEIEKDDHKLQLVRNRLSFGESHTVVDEVVTNTFYPDINRINEPQAHLIFTDLSTHKRLDLGQLLPAGYEFSPSALRRQELKVDAATGKVRPRAVPVSLEEYGKARGESKGFSADHAGKKVEYGDITTKGGMLKLLHEIAHTWHREYFGEKFGKEFNPTMYEVVDTLDGLATAYEKVRAGQLNNEKYTLLLSEKKSELEKLGVQIDDKTFLSDSHELQEGEMRLKKFSTQRSFVVRGKKLEGLAKEYTRNERDATTFAIKELRFLRKQGFDLEPELKNLQAFKDVFEPALETYQASLEEDFESPRRNLKFKR